MRSIPIISSSFVSNPNLAVPFQRFLNGLRGFLFLASLPLPNIILMRPTRAGWKFIFPTPLFLPAPLGRNISTSPPALNEQNAESKNFFTFFVFRPLLFFNLKGKKNSS